MMKRRVGRLARVLAFALTAWGCDPGGEDGSDTQGEAEAGEAESSGDVEAGCDAETRDDEYVLGMEKSGAAVRVRFVEALPAPPDRGDNTWTIEVLDLATGMPIDDAVLTVEPYMPDHMHGTSIECNVTDMPTPGELHLEPVNLFMPGLWEVRLHFTLADQTTDRVDFSFCVDP